MSKFRGFPILAVKVHTGECLVTFLSPEDIERAGLPAAAIVGVLEREDDGVVYGNFSRNRAFLELMHAVIRSAVPEIEEFREAAKRVGSGWIHVHDARAFEQDPEAARTDVVGSFPVMNGTLQPSGYVEHEEHVLVSPFGMMVLHPELQDRILAAMRSTPA